MHRCRCKDEMEVKTFRRKIEKIIAEPVFRLNIVHKILSALGHKIELWNLKNVFKNAKMNSKEFGLEPKYAASDVIFYRSSDIWNLLQKLNDEGKINLSADGLTKPADLVQFEIKLLTLSYDRKSDDDEEPDDDEVFEPPHEWHD